MDAKLLPYLTPAERGWLALAEAATPGPWDLCGGIDLHFVIGTTVRGICVVPNDGYEEAIKAADAAFITAARTALPAVLEALALARRDAHNEAQARRDAERDAIARFEAYRDDPRGPK